MLPGLNSLLDHRLSQVISIRVKFVNFRLQLHTPRRRFVNKAICLNSEETLAATTYDQVKLVKVNPKNEALSADDCGSSTSHSHQRDTNCDECWQHRLYNATRKVFRDFNKSMPTIWFNLFELKLQQCGLLANEQRKNTLTSSLPNEVLLIIHNLLINQASYQGIKQRLLQWFEPNLSSRVPNF